MDKKPTIKPAIQNMDKWRQELQEGETVVRVAGIHQGIYWKGAVMFLFSLFLLIPVFNLGLFLMFVSLVMLSLAYLTRCYLLLVLTDKRIIVRHGIVQLDTVQIHIPKIESVEVANSVMGRLIGYSTIMITGTGSRVTGVPFIENAQAFRKDLDALIMAREDAK